MPTPPLDLADPDPKPGKPEPFLRTTAGLALDRVPVEGIGEQWDLRPPVPLRQRRQVANIERSGLYGSVHVTILLNFFDEPKRRIQ